MRRTSLTLALACLLCLLTATSVRAEFSPVTWPCAATGHVAGFGASGPTWLAVCVDPNFSLTPVNGPRLSRDGGRSWTTVPGFPGQAAGVSVGPDGAFYLGVTLTSATAGQFGRLGRIDPATGSATLLAPVIPLAVPRARMSPPAWDDDGRVWVAYTDGSAGNGQATLARLTDSGTPDFLATTPVRAGDRMNLEVAARPFGTFMRAGTTVYRLEGALLRRFDAGLPGALDGALVVATRGVSVDNGATFADAGGADGVDGSTHLLNQRGRVLVRQGTSYFAPTGLASATPDARILQTEVGLVAVTDQWRVGSVDSRVTGRSLAVHVGELPGFPFAVGALNATASAMLQRANQFRAQAGLPALVGDPLISQAAENHSRYWTLNTPSKTDPLSAHNEAPGTPGFTGESMADRCAAVGTACWSEIMYPGFSGSASVDGWVATIFHRELIMSPSALMTGAGQVPGGPAVMNGGGRSGLLVGAIGFPTGRYDGPLSFSGEAPDPTEGCNETGQPVSWPLGTAVTLYVPAGDLDPGVMSMTVTPAGGRPLAGCRLGDTFLPDDPLRPGTTYTAAATWVPAQGATPRSETWSFTTAGKPETGDSPREAGRCAAKLTRAAGRVRKPASIRVRFRSCAKGSVTVGVYRTRPKTAKQRRPLASRKLKLKRARSGTVAVASKRLSPGRYTLRATLAAGKRKTLRTTVTVTRAKTRRR